MNEKELDEYKSRHRPHKLDYTYNGIHIPVWVLYDKNTHNWEITGLKATCSKCGFGAYFVTDNTSDFYGMWLIRSNIVGRKYGASCDEVIMEEALE